ncbi:MAG: hypothetical protein EB127_27310 [Alphaproteobacteria bacterium]|jgi:hypothetical protein|nr:hypothetical protein [Alphaproteobacteria bacterium]
MQNKLNLFRTGDPIWVPSGCVLYHPDMKYPDKYKISDKPVCAWYIESVNDKWAKVMYDNVFWSVEKNSIYPYPQE